MLIYCSLPLSPFTCFEKRRIFIENNSQLSSLPPSFYHLRDSVRAARIIHLHFTIAAWSEKTRTFIKTHRKLKRTHFKQTKQDKMRIFVEIFFFKATDNTKTNKSLIRCFSVLVSTCRWSCFPLSGHSHEKTYRRKWRIRITISHAVQGDITH